MSTAQPSPHPTGQSPLIVALDGMEEAPALTLARALAGTVWGFKVNDLLLRAGVEVIPRLKQYGRVFCDPKLFDIPNTVVHQVRVLCGAGADLITLHCAGGAEMIAAGQQARDAAGSSARLLGVTVLTSFDDGASQALFGRPAAEQVGRFAATALEQGWDGLVCSPLELPLLAQADPQRRLLRVTPGVRPAGYARPDDQRRTLTPPEALAAGAHLLVVGRPITSADDPVEACRRIAAGLEAAP